MFSLVLFWTALATGSAVLLYVGHQHGRFYQVTRDRQEWRRMEKAIMGDLSKLNTSLTALTDAITKLLAAQGASDQAAIDTAQGQVDTLTAQVTAATPPAP